MAGIHQRRDPEVQHPPVRGCIFLYQVHIPCRHPGHLYHKPPGLDPQFSDKSSADRRLKEENVRTDLARNSPSRETSLTI